MSTTPNSTTFRKAIVYDRETHDYAMYLDGELVGFARTNHEAEVTLDQIVFELLTGRYVNAAPPTKPTPSTDPLLPPTDVIIEALDDLTASAADSPIYQKASEHLSAGINIQADGADQLIDGVRVERAEPGACWPWPWRCACGDARCWHGALLEGILLAWERLGDDPCPLPFEAVAYDARSGVVVVTRPPARY